MEKITIKKLIEFRRKSDKSRLTLMTNLRKEKAPGIEKPKDTGGDYWISCISALGKIFLTNDKDFIREKIDYLQTKIDAASDLRTKQRFQKNIDLLVCFEDFDFSSIRPTEKLTYHKKQDDKAILLINDLPLYVNPYHVFSFSNKGINEVGAVWFIAQKNGFTTGELGMFCDVLHRYLVTHFSEDYIINPAYCIAVDIFKCQSINYTHIQSSDIVSFLDSTIEEFRNFP